jgi:FkbM family methyltransferase
MIGLGGKYFFGFNKFLYVCSLHGLGILNYESNKKSGENHFIHNQIKNIPSGVVIDVGANVGKYSIEIKKLNSNLDIYAFEPHPTTYKGLIKNTASLDIKTFNLGVGSHEAELVLYDYANNDGSEHASLQKGVIDEFHRGTAIEYLVEVVSLDKFTLKHQISSIELLKIDTEGYEFEVLKGAKELLISGKIQLIQIEFNGLNVISRVFFKDLWDFLPNYDFYRMLPDGLVKIETYDPVYCEIFAYQNYIAKLRS